MKRALGIIGCGLLLFSSQLLFSQSNDTILSKDYSNYKFKFGAGAGLGGAYVRTLGNFNEIRQNYGSLNINLLFSYHRFLYDIETVVGNSKAQGVFSNDQLTIVEDSIVGVHSIENTFGYMIIDKRRILFYPWLGLSSTSVSQKNGIEKNNGPDRTNALAGLTFGYRFTDNFSKTQVSSFEIRIKLAYNALQYFENLNVSNIRLGLSFTFHIRGLSK
jgi:hypothetical protein